MLRREQGIRHGGHFFHRRDIMHPDDVGPVHNGCGYGGSRSLKPLLRIGKELRAA
jgi:hypothetical protein